MRGDLCPPEADTVRLRIFLTEKVWPAQVQPAWDPDIAVGITSATHFPHGKWLARPGATRMGSRRCGRDYFGYAFS
jgi:hypothetical protein